MRNWQITVEKNFPKIKKAAPSATFGTVYQMYVFPEAHKLPVN